MPPAGRMMLRKRAFGGRIGRVAPWVSLGVLASFVRIITLRRYAGRPSGFENMTMALSSKLWRTVVSGSLAASYARDPKRLGLLLTSVREMANRNPQALTEAWNSVSALMRMLQAYLGKRYTEVPWKTIVAAVGGLLYLVTPLDLTPDVLPGVGLLDDFVVIGMVVRSIAGDLRRFQEWEQGESGVTDVASKPAPSLKRLLGNEGPSPAT